MTERLILALPSKGRLMNQASALFEKAGLSLMKTGHERGYQGKIEGIKDIDVSFLSASEIAHYLAKGQVHLGITGEDLLREYVPEADQRLEFLRPLGFGHADVVVAVPDSWLDVQSVHDLDRVSQQFYKDHSRKLKVATKYMNLSRRFFASNNVTDYRIVESLGATEGTPQAGTADLIVDITSTGTTLKANNLRILNDGVILKSEANLVASNSADWEGGAADIRREILQRIDPFLGEKKDKS